MPEAYKESLLLEWPLVLIVLDGYEPRLAQAAINVVREQGEETIAILWDFACEAARQQLDNPITRN